MSPAAVLLRRRDGDLQIGLGPTAVLLSDPDGHWHHLLSACQGREPLADVVSASPLPDDVAMAMLGDLAARDLVEAPRSRRRQTLRARLVGAGPLGTALARRLPTLGFTAVYVNDTAPPDAEHFPHTRARQQSEALCALLDTRCFRPVPHWSKPTGIEVALTLVCSSTIEPDRGLTDELVRADQPHLIVRPIPGGAMVGPLVVPGRTACLRCCDLRQRDADPEWPSLLHQLVRLRAPTDPVVRDWAVGVAAVQILGFLSGRRVDTESGTLELTGSEPRQAWRSWPPHPECSCQW